MSKPKPHLVFIEQKINKLHRVLIVQKKLNSSISLVDYLELKMNELYRLSMIQNIMYDQGISYHVIFCFLENKYSKSDVKHSLTLYLKAKKDFDEMSSKNINI